MANVLPVCSVSVGLVKGLEQLFTDESPSKGLYRRLEDTQFERTPLHLLAKGKRLMHLITKNKH